MAPKDVPSSATGMLRYDSINENPDDRRILHFDKMDEDTSGDPTEMDDDDASPSTSNEYVLNVAFFSFIGFVVFQTVFALIAHSESMLADSQAMAVDALTYLFNLVAERTKHRPLGPDEMELPKEVREYRKELRRLYLELVPPTISVITLVVVTIMTLREAFTSLWGEEQDENGGDDDHDVSVTIMLLFSGANLLLDVVNVTFFARANSAFGLDVVQEEHESIRRSIRMSFGRQDTHSNEGTALLPRKRHDTEVSTTRTSEDLFNGENYSRTSLAANPASSPALVNLNMCSAWTHVCADTLRSTAVLLAATVAYFAPAVRGDVADSVAAIAVSLIILVSLLPLLHGLVLTLVQIYALVQNPPSPSMRVSPSCNV